MKSILRLAVALVCTASAAYAQSGNGSDVSGPIGGVIAGGSFVPLPGAVGGGPRSAGGFPASVTTAAALAVSSTISSFTSGTPQTSPATGQAIAPAAVAAVGALLASGSPASVNSVSSALTAGGATPASVGTLMESLVTLSSSSTPASIIGALNAFNAVVTNASAAFLRNPPADFVALQAALVPMARSLVH